MVYYEGMLALVAPKEVASTPTEMLSETEALNLNGDQVASTSSLCADEHLKGGLANFSLASEDASLEKATSQNRILKSGGQLFFLYTIISLNFPAFFSLNLCARTQYNPKNT